ncbi:MAG: DUF2155 domain-containing protein [Rhodospirillum sp.]|nr:DUF2155 domain-containing protein [Rhodospirillum sp.]MCF8491186.1 DUF2155 domain-containing protein [Rhodospirillum sp.]MCF8499618.1 DUF2155 domain-containing protein [Rhodospirillum sp.]
MSFFRICSFAAPALLLVGLNAVSSPALAEEIHAQTAVLGWLDKITARVGETKVAVGDEWRLGTLSIVVRSCIREVPPDDPESGAFLDISELTDGESPREVFRGWMYASSPSLSAMDHGVYDVWVLNCEIPADLEAGEGGAPDAGATTIEPVDPGAAPLD